MAAPRSRFDRLFREAGKKYGISWRLLKAQATAESNLDPTAVSSAGAQGLSQFMPATWEEFGEGDPFDPADAIDAQGKYMATLLERFGGDEEKALAAYNAGPTRVARGGTLPKETRDYVAKIANMVPLGGGEVIQTMPDRGTAQAGTEIAQTMPDRSGEFEGDPRDLMQPLPARPGDTGELQQLPQRPGMDLGQLLALFTGGQGGGSPMGGGLGGANPLASLGASGQTPPSPQLQPSQPAPRASGPAGGSRLPVPPDFPGGEKGLADIERMVGVATIMSMLSEQQGNVANAMTAAQMPATDPMSFVRELQGLMR